LQCPLIPSPICILVFFPGMNSPLFYCFYQYLFPLAFFIHKGTLFFCRCLVWCVLFSVASLLAKLFVLDKKPGESRPSPNRGRQFFFFDAELNRFIFLFLFPCAPGALFLFHSLELFCLLLPFNSQPSPGTGFLRFLVSRFPSPYGDEIPPPQGVWFLLPMLSLFFFSNLSQTSPFCI